LEGDIQTDEWVKVGTEGTIQAFTVAYEKFEGLPDPPYAKGLRLIMFIMLTNDL
jgi:uncharacterized OB-fold protein